MIVYDKFWARLETDGISTYRLRKEGFSPTTLTKMRGTGRIDTVTIDRLCRLLDCQPGDIMEYKEEAPA